MFDIGIQELIVIFLVALMVFGPNKLPEVGRTLGKWMMEIRKGVQIAKLQMESEFEEADKKKKDDIGNYVPEELKNAGNASDEKQPQENDKKENA